MTRIVFFEKPGCINNTKQKALLEEAGHQVIARDLLAESWTPERLRPFFGARPVSEWFNPSAPRIKSGEVVPAELDEARALELMTADPLLIRRPLLEADERREAGFDPVLVDIWLGLHRDDAKHQDWETCQQDGHETR